MIPVTHKLVSVTPPAAIVDNATLVANVIDTQGFRFCRIVCYYGESDIAVASAKVQEADAKTDATTLTSGADITGTVFGTATNDAGSTSAVPSATDDNKFFTWEIDLRGRKRFLQPIIVGGNGSSGAFFAVHAELYRGEVVPTTAAQKGVDENLRVPVL